MPNGDAEKKRKGAASLWEKFRQRYPSLERFGDTPWNSEGVFPQAVVDAAKKARWEKNLPSPVRQEPSEPLRAAPIATPRADPSTGMPDLARNIPVEQTGGISPYGLTLTPPATPPPPPEMSDFPFGVAGRGKAGEILFKSLMEAASAVHEKVSIPAVSELTKYLPFKWEAPSQWEGFTPPPDPRTGMPDLANVTLAPIDTGILKNLQSTADAYMTPEGDIVPEAVMKSPFAMFNPLGMAMPGSLLESMIEAPIKEALDIPTPWEAKTVRGKRIEAEAKRREATTGKPVSVEERRQIGEELYKLPPGVRGALEELPYFAVPPMAAVRKPLQAARLGLQESQKFGRATPAVTRAMELAEVGLKPLQMIEEAPGALFRAGKTLVTGRGARVAPTTPARAGGTLNLVSDELGPVVRFHDRDIVLVEMADGTRQPFYRSTGQNSGMPGRWLPFDGIMPKGHRENWFIKDRFTEGDFGKRDNPLYRYGGRDDLKTVGDQLGELSIPKGRDITDNLEVNKFLDKPTTWDELAKQETGEFIPPDRPARVVQAPTPEVVPTTAAARKHTVEELFEAGGYKEPPFVKPDMARYVRDYEYQKAWAITRAELKPERRAAIHRGIAKIGLFEGQAAPLNEFIEGRSGYSYRAADTVEELLGVERSYDTGGRPFQWGGAFEIEFKGSPGTPAISPITGQPHHPGAMIGDIDPNTVTRVFVDPEYLDTGIDPSDITKLKRTFPRADIIEAVVNPDDPEDLRIATRFISKAGETAPAVPDVVTPPVTATAGIQSLVDDVLTTSPNLPGNRGAAQNKVLEKITQLVSGDDTAILGKKASLYNYISKQTGRSVEDLEKLVTESQAEFRQQAGQVSPTEASMNEFERGVRDSLGTYGRILRETPLGEDANAGLLKTFEGNLKRLFADEYKVAVDGGEKLHDLNVVSDRGFFSRGLHLPRNQKDIDQLDLLHEALNNPSKVETGEILLPEKFREVYDDLRTLTAKEETSRLDFDPKQATIDDYWHRGWKAPKDLANQASRTRSGRLGDVPSFRKKRSPKTYRELRDLGFEPLYWNPYDQWLHSRQMGIRHRLQNQLIRDLKRTNPSDISLTNEARKGFRIPEVGPAFEGKPGTKRVGQLVSNDLADRLENIFGKTPVIKVKVPISNRYVDLYPIVSVATFVPKRLKLLGSFFQQRDFLGRSWTGAWTGALEELRRGNPGGAAKSIFWKWPKAAYEILESNFSPGSRDRLKAWYRSAEPLVEGRPGINPAALVKAGLSQIDVTLLPTINNNIPRMVAAEAGLLGSKKAMKFVGDIESAMRRGLFEGVYAAAIKTDVANNIAKQVAREHPNFTDEQINRVIAEIANIKYSTIPASQSVVQNRVFRHILTHTLFSMGEAEGLLRQGTQAFRGRNATYWRKNWVAAYLNMLATAEVIHYLSTMEWNNGVPDITSGQHLPLARMVPFEVVQGWTPGDIFSEQVGPIMYNSVFVAPDIPIRDRSGEQVTLDLMGQLDTVFKLVDPVTWIDSRFSVPIAAARTQITGRDFYGRPIDNVDLGPIHGLTSRTIQLIQDVAVPIGTGQAVLQTVRESFPATEELIPQEEARVGMAGQWVQGPFGLNVKAQSTVQLNNMMVQRAVEADPEEAQRLGLEAGMEYKGLSIQNKNWVDEMPANQQLLEERGLRREEAVATTGEQEWWTDKRVRTEKLAQDLIGYAEEAQGKVSPYAWYRLKVEPLVSKYYDREAVLLAEGKKDFGDDFMEGIAPSDPSPDYLLEQDYFGLLFDDDADVYEKYFPDKEHVPLEDKDGRFNVLEYRKRTEALNQAAGDPNFVKNKKDALLQRRAREYNLPGIEVERLGDRVYVAENYWNLDTSDRVLELFPSDEVRQAWIKYSVMDEADKREADEVGRYASLKHRMGGSLRGYTFEEFNNSTGLNTRRHNKRRNDPKLEEILMKWGYLTTPIKDVRGGIRSRVQETGRGIPTFGMGVTGR